MQPLPHGPGEPDLLSAVRRSTLLRLIRRVPIPPNGTPVALADTHVITDRLEDLSKELRSVGQLDAAFPIERGSGDGVTHPAGRDPRRPIDRSEQKVRDIHVPDLRLGSGIKVPTRDFR